MNQKNKILFVGEDPGGFNTLWPVIKKIEADSLYDFAVILNGASRGVAKDKGVVFTDAETVANLLEFFEKENPNIVVCGTSHGVMSLDKKIVSIARGKGIKVIHIMDYWSNYKMRFSTPNTDDLIYLPDAICVIDEIMFDAMLKGGFNKKILHITGNPFFDTFGAEEGMGKEDYLIFASQPFSEEAKDDKKFSEIDIFADYVKALEEAGIKIPVIIALHPREKNMKKFDHIITKAKFKISITRDKTIDVAKKAKLVMGIRTMILFEVAMIGKKVVSYQPGIEPEDDVLVSNHLGLSVPAYSYPELVKKLSDTLYSHKATESLEAVRKKYVLGDATGKVISVIEEVLSGSQSKKPQE